MMKAGWFWFDEQDEDLCICGQQVKVAGVCHGEVVVVVLRFATSSENTHHLLE